MENSELVVPANSRISDRSASEISGLRTSPPPPKSSPVSSVSRLSLTSKIKQDVEDDCKTVQFEEIRREKNLCSSIGEEVADVLKSRLYDSAGTSDVYRNHRTQVK
jgi:hypothetical protein